MENMRSPESYLRDVQPDIINSVLDVGVGYSGIFDFANYEKMDLNKKTCTDISFIREDIPDTWKKIITNKDDTHLPFIDSEFSVVQCLDVIQFVGRDKWDLFINELERVSKDLIYITVSDDIGLGDLDSVERRKYVGFPGQDYFKLKGYHTLFLDPHHLKCFKKKVDTWGEEFYDMEDYVRTVGMIVTGGVSSVLDCGTGQKGVVAQDYYENGVKIKKGYACDIWTLKEMNKKVWTGLKINALNLLDKGKGGIGEKSVDIVQAFGFLEHLTKTDGYQFLHIAEKVARKAVIISAAAYVHGDSPNEKAIRDGNPYHRYNSVWHWKEFEKLGYKSNFEHMRQGLTFSEEVIAWKIL